MQLRSPHCGPMAAKTLLQRPDIMRRIEAASAGTPARAQPAPLPHSPLEVSVPVPASNRRALQRGCHPCSDTAFSGWDRQFESAFLQRRVSGELRNRLHSGDRHPAVDDAAVCGLRQGDKTLSPHISMRLERRTWRARAPVPQGWQGKGADLCRHLGSNNRPDVAATSRYGG
jgi:hypothetical protein